MLKHVKTPFHSWDLMRVLDCQALFSEFHSLKMLRASPQSPAWSRRHPSLVDKSMRCIVKKMFSYGYFWVETIASGFKWITFHPSHPTTVAIVFRSGRRHWLNCLGSVWPILTQHPPDFTCLSALIHQGGRVWQKKAWCRVSWALEPKWRPSQLAFCPAETFCFFHDNR